MADTRGKDYLSLLDRRLSKVPVTREHVKIVVDLLETADSEPSSGMMADAIVKQLAKKYYQYCKKSMSLPVFLNAAYAVITGDFCEIPYVVAVAYRQAEKKRDEDGLRLPIEFYLSETLEVVDTAPATFKVFAEEDNESSYTLGEALEGMTKSELVFPTDTNRVIPYPNASYFLAFVESKTRWVAVLASDVAAHVSQFSNPIVNTPKGLMQGDFYLRCLGNRRGIVVDDFVVL